jgi:Glycine zipper
MKFQILIASVVIMAASCNTQPKAEGAKDATDTTGMGAYNAWKISEGGLSETEEAQNSSSSTTKKTSGTSSSATNTNKAGDDAGTGTGANSGSGAGTSSTGTEKKGWSKTAKGAVIGGVVGAGTGAVVNKKNRAAGAVIGGVVGAGAGAVIGNEMDKKDGRH